MSWGASRGPKHALTIAVTAILALTTACGDDQDDDITGPGSSEPSSTPETTDLPPCGEIGELVTFSINGLLTLDEELANWLGGDPAYVMEARPGAAELATAYHDRGYHLLYATRGGADIDVHGMPYDEALEGWLQSQGFPLDERARLLMGAFERELADELLAWSSDGGGTYAAYTNGEQDVAPLVSGGVPQDRVYTMGEAAGVPGTEVMADSDLTAHLSELGDPPPACRIN